ncbi:alpha/beta hydrolase-fold protein [Bacteroides ovatus]
MAACTDNDKEHSIILPEQESEGGVSSDYTELLNKTTPVPPEYNQEFALKGSVVQIDYDTQNYVEGNGEMRKNTAYVYLPYGYEEVSDQCYNVFYFVHGHGETAVSFFQNENGLLCKLLDHMIGNGDMAPTIVVSTSYVYGNPVDYYPDADPYCEALPQELVNDLIPIVENRYHTYTESTDIVGIKASREHRAIGGFSMGAVTTWYALEHTLDCFKYFIPISSDSWSLGRFAGMDYPTETADYFANIVRSATSSKNDFYIWACSGTDDVAYDRIWTQVQAMAQLSDVFSVGNLTFHEQEGARHEFRSLAEYLYNALPFLFPI